MSQLRQATTPVPLDEGGYRVALSPTFHNLNDVPQGGYVLAVALRAALEETGRPHVVTASAHYLRPVVAGQCEVEVEVLRSGRRFDVAEVRISQEGTLRAAALVTLGEIGVHDGASHHPAMPTFPPLSSAEVPIATPISDYFLLEAEEDHSGFFEGRLRAEARANGRIRPADPAQPMDQLTVPVLADWRPPTPFLVGVFGMVPTVELDVHFVAPPPYAALRVEIWLDDLHDGQAVESTRFWDDDGRLVATARQLMLVVS